MNLQFHRWIGVVCIVAISSSCQTARTRSPASSDATGRSALAPKLSVYATLEAEVDHLRDRAKLKSKGLKEADRNLLAQKEKELVQLRSEIEAAQPNASRPMSIEVPYTDRAYTTQETIVLEDLTPYRVKEGELPRVAMALAQWRTHKYRIELINRVSAKMPKPSEHYLSAELICDGLFDLDLGGPSKVRKNLSNARFRMYDRATNAQTVHFMPHSGTKGCKLWFYDPFDRSATASMHGIRFEAESAERTRTPDLAKSQFCFLPKTAATDAASLFVSPDFRQLTCPEVANAMPLADPLEGLNAKIEMLLGQKLSEEALSKQDPYMELDFSKAPKLDSILISYLVFRADFSGTLISRMLQWHAERGTTVKVIVSGVISLEKDIRMFQRLNAAHPNIKVHVYEFKNPQSFTIGRKFSELHRTMHIKLFITTSERDPKANGVIIGGRNIHDAFYFREPKPRDPSWKDVVDYIGGDEAFVHWNDFEVKIASKDFTRKVAEQYFTVWNQDADTFLVRNYSHQFSNGSPLDPSFFDVSGEAPIVRHLVSIPYKDGRQLEQFYVKMIDSARRTLFFSTPYFNLTPAIQNAVERAVDRGVKITLLTRIELEGDTADIVLSEVNKRAINKFKDRIQVFEYTENKVILHSKFVLIDGNVSFVGGVNLNKRSFIHDTENGVLFYSAEFHAFMEKLFRHYQIESRPVTEKQRIAFWKRIVIGIFDDAF